MNVLEQKCAIMAQTPQTRWYDLRLKAFVQLLNNMISRGEIKGVATVPNPTFSMMNIQVSAFNYQGSYYVLFINKVGNVYDCFHLETPNTSVSQLSNTLSSHIVLSSDDNPKEDTFLPIFALTIDAKSNQDLISKLKTILGE